MILTFYQSVWTLPLKVNCQDHRATMQLLSLKRKLEKGIADPEEEKEIKRMIQELETKLDLE